MVLKTGRQPETEEDLSVNKMIAEKIKESKKHWILQRANVIFISKEKKRQNSKSWETKKGESYSTALFVSLSIPEREKSTILQDI